MQYNQKYDIIAFMSNPNTPSIVAFGLSAAIALVAFNNDPELLKTVAPGIRNEVAMGTAGLIDPKITVMTASPAAKAAFAEANKDDACVDTKKAIELLRGSRQS